MAVWILAACLAAAVVLAALLWLALRKARASAAATDALVAQAQKAVREAVATETAAHAEEIRRVLARERAETAALLGITPTAVSTRLHRALAKLEERMRHDVVA